ncbi:MAG TPA: phosphonate ABC transporter ATP-binding protein [Xanthomonadales bacterium]|nr:phosphonate ABC transporter ATP-binding protein [Xanthomonadales bacterium]
MIELNTLEKSIALPAGRQWLLRNINLTIHEGDFLSIMGPSGSGKTSLLSVLGLLDADWQGEYHFDGQPVHAMKDRQRKAFAREHIALVFQHYHLLDDLTVAENIELPLSYRDVPGSQRKARVADLLDRFGIVAKRDLFPRQLSGGQQQMVAVARAIVTRPRLLLADEPTGALHSSQGEMIMDLLTELNRAGTTIVQVTHNPEYAARGNRRCELFDGWLRP